jgi:SAM-dependent methyltransferase
MDTVDQVRAKMTTQNNDSTTSSWEQLWQDGLTPWDLGKPTPLLIDELEKQRTNSSMNKRQMRTLVPGCGTGYDLLTLQSHHNYMAIQQQQQQEETSSLLENVVVGIDMSATALQSAERLVDGHVSNLTRLELQCGDFFNPPAEWETVYRSSIPGGVEEKSNKKEDDSPKDLCFDLIFDYTFFCALPPSLRSKWGAQMANLLNPTNGRLTLDCRLSNLASWIANARSTIPRDGTRLRRCSDATWYRHGRRTI